jgi:hypothetical protein
MDHRYVVLENWDDGGILDVEYQLPAVQQLMQS